MMKKIQNSAEISKDSGTSVKVEEYAEIDYKLHTDGLLMKILLNS